jgi:poly(hydroxyalkanoate) depolymerase family esterase
MVFTKYPLAKHGLTSALRWLKGFARQAHEARPEPTAGLALHVTGQAQAHAKEEPAIAPIAAIAPDPRGQPVAPSPPVARTAAAPMRPAEPTPAPASMALAEVDATPTVAPAIKPRRATFSRQLFAFEGERYRFNLYLPAAPDASVAMPLVVMLHGCRQNAPDFARGTAMNECAARVPCAVLYPEQLASANQMRCWNWFDLAHQGRHAGEPAMLAALTRQVAARYPIDPGRIYIAGLSAGGAMAAIVAAHNPDLFAAVGVHSGLPPGAAHDVMSAFSAMRHGRRRGGKPQAQAAPDGASAASAASADAAGEHDDLLPTIVFHGSADRTVHPDNGDQIVQAAIAAVAVAGVPLARQEMPQALPAATGELRNTLRTVYRGPNGRSYVEYWSVEAGPHAWSGGNEAGSYTDPHGPSASQAMLDFFLQHRREQS